MLSRLRNRRDFLRLTCGALGIAASASLLGAARTAAAQAPIPLRQIPLRDGLTMLETAEANMLLLRTPAGGVLVDSGAPGQAKALSQAVADELGGEPLAALFNTHWHLDHTGANDVFGKAGTTRIIAHESTRLWMSTEYYVDWQDTTYAPRAAEALPNDTFYSSDPQPFVLDVGGERIEYGHLREAHTDGDIYVRFRERNVIAAGGAVGGGSYPIIDYATGGWIGGLIDANQKLLEIANEDTLIVGHAGFVQTRAQLRDQHEMLRTMRERIEGLMRKGKSAAEMIASGVTKDFDGRYGTDGALFIRNAYEGLWWAGRLTNSL